MYWCNAELLFEKVYIRRVKQYWSQNQNKKLDILICYKEGKWLNAYLDFFIKN
jgi:hypothetical protein